MLVKPTWNDLWDVGDEKDEGETCSSRRSYSCFGAVNAATFSSCVFCRNHTTCLSCTTTFVSYTLVIRHSFTMLSFAPTVLLALAAAVNGLPTSSLSKRAESATPRNMCGAPNDSELIWGTPWIVFSMNYNYKVRYPCNMRNLGRLTSQFSKSLAARVRATLALSTRVGNRRLPGMSAGICPRQTTRTQSKATTLLA